MTDETTRLLGIMERLRDPDGGCPWDVEQTFETIAPYTIEEAYEVADAIGRRAYGELRSELGDLLLQVVYHARIAEEAGLFSFADVAKGVADKMVERHPHVFGGAAAVASAQAQKAAWEDVKAAERAAKAEASGAAPSVLDDVALALPALMRAHKLQKRAARVGFDWPDASGPRAKVLEELGEIEVAAAEGNPDDVAEEVGDLLFAAVNLARHRGVEPEEALRAANAKFERRFRAVERLAAERGLDVKAAGIDALDRLWDEVKTQG